MRVAMQRVDLVQVPASDGPWHCRGWRRPCPGEGAGLALMVLRGLKVEMCWGGRGQLLHTAKALSPLQHLEIRLVGGVDP